jgi:3-hydroxyisobutyrate dehydrogenase-like beta-hydroxyacid dehydrogenase
VRVAVAGAGRMGSAMAVRLRGAGHDVVVYNRTRSRAEQTGAAVAGGPREAAAQAEVVIVSLADDAAVKAVYSELVTGLRPGAVVMETSTIHPDTVRGLVPLVEQHSAALLDAPVSGSVPVVQRGELTFLVGGDAAALERARPVMDALGSRVFHLGEVGAGAVMKLAVNVVIQSLNQAVSEALVLAEKAGVPRAQAYDVFAASAVAAPFVHYKREAFVNPDQAPAAFVLDLVAKDMDLAGALARGVGARMDQLAANRKVVAEAIAAGLGQHDMSALAVLLRGQGG